MGLTPATIGVFEVPFDPEEGTERLEARRRSIAHPPPHVLQQLRKPLQRAGCQLVSPPPVDTWATSFPRPEDAPLLSPQVFRHFVGTGGCRAVSDLVRDLIGRWPPHWVPGLVGVDHSLTGGALEAVTGRIGPAAAGLLVFDAHLDAIPQWARAGLMELAREAGPNHLAAGPVQAAGPAAGYAAEPLLDDPYHCGSFLSHLWHRGVVSPRHTVLIGLADTPPASLRAAADPRARHFVREYDRWLQAGVRAVTQAEIQSTGVSAHSLAEWLANLRGRRVYISFDMDVVAGPDVPSVRFRELAGLRIREAQRLWDLLPATLQRLDIRPVGFDLMEIDPIALHAGRKSHPDRTLQMAARVIQGWAECLSVAAPT